MTNEPKQGGDHDPPRPIVREVLESLLKKYIDPLADKLDALALSLKSADAREVVNLRAALEDCREEAQQLKYEIVELKTKVGLSEDSSRYWRQKYEQQEKDLIDAKLEVSFLKSRIDNMTGDGAHES